MSSYSKQAADAVPSNWDAYHIPSQKDKVAIVTGGNSGVGYETALELVRKGAQVVLGCRNEGRGAEAVKKIQAEVADAPEAGSVAFIKLDMADLSTVKSFADEFRKTHNRLDLLINNAGVSGVQYGVTVDGFESHIGINHLGPFALTAQLFDLLKQSPHARIVNVSSMKHRSAKLDVNKLMLNEDNYNGDTAYDNSKLGNILFTFELTRRCEANGISNILAVASHPGASKTNILVEPTTNNKFWDKMKWKFLSILPVYQPASMGALPSLYAATAPGVKSGEFYGPGGFMSLGGHPALEDPSEDSKSATTALKLWEVSEQLTKVSFPITK
ncbi:hypothetical protein Poli38472_003760 [Pythium oligandrum]|uniref:Uncharacterized protein n=1 Tax=Pythium oligandrum TaxID=41045 RepID=A0A8K1CMG0_PYTOL|nr:hypothetical protein Poli38472_003760 [Pythium oligandrum]|eukprot:TMW65995.1 hypothetical protein Poli38472_003760 [Pythium oligandrum]